MSEPVYDKIQSEMQVADSNAAMHALIAQNAELTARLSAVESAQNKPKPLVTDVGPGGAPVKHHLHLVDGRVIPNHDGIGTHYSDENGVTRIVGYFPAVEADPTPSIN